MSVKTTVESSIEQQIIASLYKIIPASVHTALHSARASKPLPAHSNPLPERYQHATSVPTRPPKEGGRCWVIWNELDRWTNAGVSLTVAQVAEFAAHCGWSVNSAKAEFYRWKAYRLENPLRERGIDRRVRRSKPRKIDRRAGEERRAS